MVDFGPGGGVCGGTGEGLSCWTGGSGRTRPATCSEQEPESSDSDVSGDTKEQVPIAQLRRGQFADKSEPAQPPAAVDAPKVAWELSGICDYRDQ